ncbi:helix-turn-helix transcriptional regulator [Niveispirillum sp. KHB5.9]|uniref:helix-turn-helix transcriptional regulator n=1 Tax=Niveispirillum sp. KHB5.9 TaxID=3400269 RepID=UPI003A850788
MRASRLLSLLLLLQLRGPLTAAAMAAELEVSERTIYRDIDALSEAGVPVYGDRGPGGGFQLLEGYRTRLTGLASDEAEAMFTIGLPGLAGALGVGQAAARAWNKLMLALPAQAREEAGRMGDRFHLDAADWYRVAEPTPFLPDLARAVLDSRRVEMRYESWKGFRDWTLDPLGLVLKAGTWYFAGRADARMLVFKVASIRDLTVTRDGFTRPDEFHLPGFWVGHLAEFEERLRPERADLSVSAAGRDRLVRLGAYAAEAVAAAGPADGDGWTDLTLPYENMDQAARLLLGLGPEVRVRAPDALRRLVAELATGILARMSETVP